MLHIYILVYLQVVTNLRPPRQSSGRWAGRLPPLELHPMPMDDGLSHMVAGCGARKVEADSIKLRSLEIHPIKTNAIGVLKKKGTKDGTRPMCCMMSRSGFMKMMLPLWWFGFQDGLLLDKILHFKGGCLYHFSILVAIPSGCKMVSINYMLPW